jgi:hypothetical protein
VVPKIQLTSPADKRIDGPMQQLSYRYVDVRQWYGQGIDFDQQIWEEKTRSYSVHELEYSRDQKRNLYTNQFSATAQAGKGFVRLMLDTKHSFIYSQKDKTVHLHAFAGALPYFENPDANVALTFNGVQSNGFFSKDYLYDELLLSRNATKGLASQLTFSKDAQLKTLYNGGISERWMVSAGISFETPLPIPVQPYIDAVLYHDPFENKARLSYSAGLSLVLWKEVVEMYVPLVESADIRNSLTYTDRNTLGKRISILLNLKALHPFDFMGF